jgi:hypothetical protein
MDQIIGGACHAPIGDTICSRSAQANGERSLGRIGGILLKSTTNLDARAVVLT